MRRAVPDDLDEMLELADRRRRQYEQYQPAFWRPAEDAVPQQRAFFGQVLDDPAAVVLVAHVQATFRGFLIARVVPAPPVYDPGGPTGLVDDFTAHDHADWPVVGRALLDAARTWSAEKGAVQMVVVTARLDAPKRAALRRAALTPASEWWVAPGR